MSSIIQIKNTALSGSVPSNLTQGELAINVTNGRLFYGSGSRNIVKEFTGSGGGGSSISASYATTASFASNGGVTQLLAGPNVTLSPASGLGQVTVSATLSGSTIFNTATGSYGSFYDTTTQTNVAGTARSMSLNTTDISNGVSVSGSTNPFNTYIKMQNAGVYDIQFSAQVDKTDSGTDEIWIWLRKNGTNLADTATSIQLVGNGAHYVAAWNFFVNAAANDYFQLMWYSPDANVRLHAESAFGVVPGIPSLIVTANRVDQFLSNTGSFSGSFTGQFTGSLFGTSSWATNSLTASRVNTLNQSVIITGSVTIGSSSIGPSENTLTLGPSPGGGVGEGGQLGLQATGGSYTSASFLDTYQNYFRILKGTNIGGSTAQMAGLDLQTGNLSIAGALIPSAWNVGDIIQMKAFKPGDSGVYAINTAGTSTSNECFFSCSFTPKSTTSHIVVNMHAKYEPAGGGADDFYSTITINGPTGTEAGFSYQKFSASAGADRSGVLFPLLGRYTNSSTSTITICANVRRGTSDDNIAFDSGNSNSMTMTITEIGR